MRLVTTACAIVVLACVAIVGVVVLAQKSSVPAPTPVLAAPAAAPAPAAVVTKIVEPTVGMTVRAAANGPAAAASSCPGNPDALGVARVVEIDTTGGPGFGFEHFKTHDFLREGEVVLTFDLRPSSQYTDSKAQSPAEAYFG
jgi:hypothetical protein